MKTFIIGNFVAAFFIGYSLNTIYEMINSLQITSHLPLNNISFTNNVMETFDFLFEVVTFDYFDVSAHVDFGFTETSFWSYRFKSLGYESFNLIKNLGSITIFIALNLLVILIAALMIVCRRCVICKLRH